MIFNTLIKSIDEERIKCIGYVYGESFKPRHWFQFADDTAIVTSTEEDSQALLNVFTKWSHWADLIIHLKKCFTFGLKKNGKKACQFKPYLKINNGMIPAIDIGDNFKYLGKEFSFDMDTTRIKEKLEDKIKNYFEKLDRLPLHPKNKMKIISIYIYSKIKWEFSIYDLSITWVKQHLDSIVKSKVKRWLQLHPGGNFDHLKLPATKLGLNFLLPSDIYDQCKLSIRNILKSSKNEDIKLLAEATKDKNIKYENLLTENSYKAADKALKKVREDTVTNHLETLKESNSIMGFIKNHTSNIFLNKWKTICDSLPKNIFVFVRKALIFALPNKTNLLRWKISNDDKCNLCYQKETQLHMLSFCNTALKEGRYTWRHNSVMSTMLWYLKQLNGINVLADLPGHRNPAELFTASRPDIVLYDKNTLTIVELTVCFDTNPIKSRNGKIVKYSDIQKELTKVHGQKKINKIFVEITNLGFVTTNIKDFTNLFKNTDINTTRMISKMTEVAIRCSFYIYIRRNKPWTNPEILVYY